MKSKSPVPMRLRQAAMSAAHEADSLRFDLPHLAAHAESILRSPEATPHIKKDAQHVLKHAKRIQKSTKGLTKNLKAIPEARSHYNWIASARRMVGKPKI